MSLSSPNNPADVTDGSDQRKIYTCPKCQLEYKIRNDLKAHMFAIHNIEAYTCDGCPEMFFEEAPFKEHVKVVHDGRKRHFCRLCPSTYKSSKQLLLHVEHKHKIEESMFCPECGQEFHNSVAHKMHLQLYHKSHHVYHKCKSCNKSFRAKAHLVMHREFDHKKGGKARALEYIKKLNIKNDLKTDATRCKACKVKFKTSIDFIHHLRVDHTLKTKRFTCCQCTDALFTTRAALGLHMRHDHGLVNHSCPKCPPSVKPHNPAPLKIKQKKEKMKLKTESDSIPQRLPICNLFEITKNPYSYALNDSLLEAPWARRYIREDIPSDLDSAQEIELNNLSHNIKTAFNILCTVAPSRLKASGLSGEINKTTSRRVFGNDVDIMSVVFGEESITANNHKDLDEKPCPLKSSDRSNKNYAENENRQYVIDEITDVTEAILENMQPAQVPINTRKRKFKDNTTDSGKSQKIEKKELQKKNKQLKTVETQKFNSNTEPLQEKTMNSFEEDKATSECMNIDIITSSTPKLVSKVPLLEKINELNDDSFVTENLKRKDDESSTYHKDNNLVDDGLTRDEKVRTVSDKCSTDTSSIREIHTQKSNALNSQKTADKDSTLLSSSFNSSPVIVKDVSKKHINTSKTNKIVSKCNKTSSKSSDGVLPSTPQSNSKFNKKNMDVPKEVSTQDINLYSTAGKIDGVILADSTKCAEQNSNLDIEYCDNAVEINNTGSDNSNKCSNVNKKSTETVGGTGIINSISNTSELIVHEFVATDGNVEQIANVVCTVTPSLNNIPSVLQISGQDICDAKISSKDNIQVQNTPVPVTPISNNIPSVQNSAQDIRDAKISSKDNTQVENTPVPLTANNQNDKAKLIESTETVGDSSQIKKTITKPIVINKSSIIRLPQNVGMKYNKGIPANIKLPVGSDKNPNKSSNLMNSVNSSDSIVKSNANTTILNKSVVSQQIIISPDKITPVKQNMSNKNFVIVKKNLPDEGSVVTNAINSNMKENYNPPSECIVNHQDFEKNAIAINAVIINDKEQLNSPSESIIINRKDLRKSPIVTVNSAVTVEKKSPIQIIVYPKSPQTSNDKDNLNSPSNTKKASTSKNTPPFPLVRNVYIPIHKLELKSKVNEKYDISDHQNYTKPNNLNKTSSNCNKLKYDTAIHKQNQESQNLHNINRKKPHGSVDSINNKFDSSGTAIKVIHNKKKDFTKASITIATNIKKLNDATVSKEIEHVTDVNVNKTGLHKINVNATTPNNNSVNDTVGKISSNNQKDTSTICKQVEHISTDAMDIRKIHRKKIIDSNKPNNKETVYSSDQGIEIKTNEVLNKSVSPDETITLAVDNDFCNIENDTVLQTKKESNVSPPPVKKSPTKKIQVYYCGICPMQLTDKIALLNHLTEKHVINEEVNSTPYECEICTIGCKTRDLLDHHIRTEHNDTISGKRIDKAHVKIQECADENTDKTRNISVDHIKSVRSSRRTRKQLNPRKIRCETCNKTFATALFLYNHNRVYHRDTIMHKCDNCSSMFSNKKNFISHKCKMQDIFYCRKCKIDFPNKIYLDEHRHERHSLGTLKCDYCCKYFKSNLNLQKHMSQKHIDHSVKAELKSNKSFISRSDTTIYDDLKIINEASKNLSDKNSSKNKNDNHNINGQKHGSKRKMDNYDSKSKTDNHNSKSKTDNHDSKSKTDNHDSKNKTDNHDAKNKIDKQDNKNKSDDHNCKNTIHPKKKGATDESKLDLTPKRLYKCLKCTKKFTQKDLLMAHIKKIHKIANTLYKCDKCNCVFKFEDKLKQHLKLKHDNLKESSDNAQAKTTSGPKMYDCTECGAFLPSMESLQRHRQWEHVKSHKCDYCGERLPTAEEFLKHLISGHGNEKAKEGIQENSFKWKTQLANKHVRQAE